jgi:hypothetical protein
LVYCSVVLKCKLPVNYYHILLIPPITKPEPVYIKKRFTYISAFITVSREHKRAQESNMSIPSFLAALGLEIIDPEEGTSEPTSPLTFLLIEILFRVDSR